jgi:hypothetical protein
LPGPRQRHAWQSGGVSTRRHNQRPRLLLIQALSWDPDTGPHSCCGVDPPRRISRRSTDGLPLGCP